MQRLAQSFLPLTMVAACSLAGDGQPGVRSETYLKAVRRFADGVLEYGRDTYGGRTTPLFIDGLHARTRAPATWKKGGETWFLSNFASQQPLMRTLDGLTAVTGEARYRKAAEEATSWALEHTRAPNGLLCWGGHLAWDLGCEKPVGQYNFIHELKNHQPYYHLMWRMNPAATRRLLETIWATHILDWALLDYNRHADGRKKARPRWDHTFKDDVEVPFPAKGGNLSFANVTPPLLHAGVSLSTEGKDADALRWTHRLIRRWQQGRHAKTGLCGGQLSYRTTDRTQLALGHVHPTINEAKVVASYHQTSRYHTLPLAQLQAAERLVAAGGACGEVGRAFLKGASEDLKTYARRCYDPATGTFPTMMIDGTRLQWEKARTGYYTPQSFAPRKPDSFLLWGYCLAYRVTRGEEHWQMARRLGRHLGLGDLGQPGGADRKLTSETDVNDWGLIYALLELHRATKEPSLLKLAARVADNLLKLQAPTGLFPRPGRDYARTGDEIPLALLHLAAAIGGTRGRLPPAIFDSRFFHCVYDGPLTESQRKRADARTYDNNVYYGGK